MASSETTDSVTTVNTIDEATESSEPNINKVNCPADDDDDLEEGELKDDDDDSDDDDDELGVPVTQTEPKRLLPIGVNLTINPIPPDTANLDAGCVEEQSTKRKRKRVVRKIKRKIKVIKKVPRKKADQQQQQQQAQQQLQQTQQQQPTGQKLPYNQPNNNQRVSHGISNSNQESEGYHQQTSGPLILPPINQHQTPAPLLPNTQQTQPMLPQSLGQQQSLRLQANTPGPNGNNLDSLWEQQILMLQELQRQQHAQILRAAATDEDLRYLQISYSPIVNPQVSQSNSLEQSSTQQQQPQSLLPLLHQQPRVLEASNNYDQTPNSPDDENGKSSYEAISKMLTLLRNSSETNESDPDQLESNNSGDQSQANNISVVKNTVEYSLIPVIVEGIDYTKYKLLSQYEPKFKNDPRLYQQA